MRSPSEPGNIWPAGGGEEGESVGILDTRGARAGATRLLVVDGDADMREYLQRLLRPLADIEVAADGHEALAAIDRQLPDLVVTDVTMPNTDGVEFVRALRTNPRTQSLPIVMLSDRAGDEAPVEDYILKPFSAGELVARVRSQLELARQRNEYTRALDEVNERFRALVVATSAVVYRMNADWTEMRHLVGPDFISDTTDPSRTWLARYIPPDEQPRVTAAIAAAIESRSVFELEHRVLRVDGTLGWTFSRAIPQFDRNGELVEWFGAASDITTRKEAEEALRASEERYRSLFESIDEGFCIFDMIYDDEDNPIDYRFVEVNPAFEKHTGLVAARGKTIRELVPGHEQYWFDAYGEVARTGEPVRFENRGEGMNRWFDVYAFRFGEPAARRVAAVFADITERKAAERALLEADRRKDEFLAVLSHELRNPLAPISNSLYLLDHVPPNSEQATHAKQVIDRQVKHLSSLVNDLLDTTRIVSGKIQLQRERIDLNEVVRRAVDDNRSLYEQAHIALAFEPAPHPVHVHADRTRVAQIVGNLLNNSAKFTLEGGRTRATVSREDNTGVIRIVDDGVGIAAEMLGRLFEPFAQAEQNLDRSKGGLGLGLALVRSLAELHGGTASARSDGLGTGAELTVRLPLDTSTVIGAAAPAATSPSPARRRVLIIEDNADAAEMLGQVLSIRGNDVAVAHDGATGLEKARALRPDIVLCDLGLPGMDGYDVARAIRSDPALAGTFLIALSGYARIEDLARATEAGFDRHLAKPVGVERLMTMFAEVPGHVARE